MISTFLARSKLRQIIGLLEEERAVLLRGPLSSLPALTAQRTAILEALENGGPVARRVLGGGLDQIRALAMRNKKLFEASVAGMKSASDTLRVLERNLGSMETYTSTGDKVRVQPALSKKDHRV